MRPGQVGVSGLSFLQCFDTVGWVTGRASGPRETCATFPRSSSPEHVEEEADGKKGRNPG